jgi:hypothetical protein
MRKSKRRENLPSMWIYPRAHPWNLLVPTTSASGSIYRRSAGYRSQGSGQAGGEAGSGAERPCVGTVGPGRCVLHNGAPTCPPGFYQIKGKPENAYRMSGRSPASHILMKCCHPSLYRAQNRPWCVRHDHAHSRLSSRRFLPPVTSILNFLGDEAVTGGNNGANLTWFHVGFR